MPDPVSQRGLTPPPSNAATRGRGSARGRLISSLVMLAVVAGAVAFYSIRKSNQLFDLGVDAHVHCTTAGVYPRQTQRVEMEQALGAPFAPMLQPLLDAAGSGGVVSAFQCPLGGRNYLQVIFKNGEALVSVMLTRRNDQEIFPRALAGRTVEASGIRLHESRRQKYSVAAFESGGWLGFVVSALSEDQNGDLAARVAPVVARYTGP